MGKWKESDPFIEIAAAVVLKYLPTTFGDRDSNFSPQIAAK